MFELVYNGNFKNDLKIVEKNWNIWRVIGYLMLVNGLLFPLPFFLGIASDILLIIFFYLIFMIEAGILSYWNRVNKTKLAIAKHEAKERLENLVWDLNAREVPIEMDDLKNSMIRSINTHQEVLNQKKKMEEKIEQVDNYYTLDKNENIVVLRSVYTLVKNEKEEKEECQLFLMEDQELLDVPVKKSLRFK